MRKHLAMLLGCLTVLIALSACAKQIILHPLTDKDIKKVSISGQNWTCMTPEYIQEVMNARLGK